MRVVKGGTPGPMVQAGFRKTLFSSLVLQPSLYQPAPPSRLSCRAQRTSCLCPAPTQGISFAGRGNAAGLSGCCLQATPEELLLFLGSLGRVAVLIVGVAGSIYLEVPCPGLQGHNLGTRQCLGHQAPARTWAHCQEWLCWDALLSVLPPL